MSEKKSPKPPVRCSDDVLNIIFDRIAGGESLVSICSTDDMPSRKCFFEWVEKDNNIKNRYECAMQMRADFYAERMLEEADLAVGKDAAGVQAQRLIIDTLKWHASKLAPKKYGDRTIVEGTGKDGAHLLQNITNVTDDELLQIAAGK